MLTDMKALVLERYGNATAWQLHDRPLPNIGPNDLLVRVHAAGLNPVDFKTRQGKLRIIQRYRLPVIMGNELAGVVEACGSAVTRFKAGDRIFARMPKDRMGAFAEYAAVPESVAAIMPATLDFDQTAAVPLAGLTALQALRDELQLKPGTEVLITGGAGGVGTFAIQIAKWLGARVFTTASPRGRNLVERLGADHAIDYTVEDISARVSNVDGVLDLVGGEALDQSFGVVKPGGTVVTVVATPEPETARKDLGRGFALQALFWLASRPLRSKAKRNGARYRFLFMHPSGAELSELAALIEAGILTPIVDRVFPFAEIETAFAYLETGRAKGKVVVSMQAGASKS